MRYYKNESRRINRAFAEREDLIEIGPGFEVVLRPNEFARDILRQRTYFLLKIGRHQSIEDVDRVIKRIVEQADAYHRAYSDIIIIAHGWHRTIGQATATYDRLFGRIPRLLYQDRIGGTREKPYDPLYIAIHWESETGPNLWSSTQSIPNREEFVARVSSLFTLSQSNYELDVDLAYDALVKATVLGLDMVHVDPKLSTELHGISSNLWQLRPKHSNYPDGREWLTVLWRCFFDSAPIRTVFNQTPMLEEYQDLRYKPSGSSSPRKENSGSLQVSLVWTIVTAIAVLRAVPSRTLPTVVRLFIKGGTLLGMLAAPVAIVDVLGGTKCYAIDPPVERAIAANHYAINVCILQLVCSIPLLALTFTLFVLTYPIRSTKPGKAIQRWWEYIAPTLSKLGDLPYSYWEERCPHWQLSSSAANTIRSYVAFWKMAQRAKLVGIEAAGFVEKLYERMGDKLSGTNLHLIGHSFGARVVAEAAARMSAKYGGRTKVDTLTLLSGALNAE